MAGKLWAGAFSPHLVRIGLRVQIPSVIFSGVETESLQPHFDFNLSPPDWVAVRMLVAEIEQEISERRGNLLYRLSLWLCAVKMFRRTEEKKLILVDPQPRDVQFHRVLLTSLLGFGESLLLDVLDHTEVDPKHLGLQVEDLRAMVETLRMNYTEWYSDMTPARREAALREIVG